MPRLSVTGKAVMGIAGIRTSVDGAVPSPLATSSGGGWDWLDSGTTIVGPADTGSGYKFWTLTLPSTLTFIANGESTHTRAGGGVWERFLAGTGLRTNVTALLPSAGIGSVDSDGTFAFCTNYQANSGVSVYSSAGTLIRQFTATLTNDATFIALRGGVLTYPSQQGFPLFVAATGAAVPNYVQPQGVYRAIPVLAAPYTPAGAVVIMVEMIQSSGQDVWTIRRADRQTGLTVNSAPAMGSPTPIFGMDARMVGGLVRLAWSTNQGESTNALVTLDVNTATGATTRGTVSGGGMVYAPGPTLTGTTFDMANAPQDQLPAQTQPVVNLDRTITLPWRDALRQTNVNVTSVQTQVNKIPAPIPYGNAEVLTHGDPSPFPLGREVVDSGTIVWDFSQPGLASASVRNGSVGGLGLGLDGEDGRDGWPGVTGPTGATGATGAAGTPGIDGADGDTAYPLVYPGTSVTPASVQAAGYWAPVSNGDPASPEIVFDSFGNVVVAFTPTP